MRIHRYCLLFLLISFASFAADKAPAYPFALDLNALEPLGHNPNILSYKMDRVDSKKVIVNGRLSDGNLLKITLQGGETWSKIAQKTIPSSDPDLTEKAYWLNQAVLFAKQTKSEKNLADFKRNIKNHKFTQVAAKNKLYFEKYTEGNYESIQISQCNHETVIVLQQSAC